MADISSSIIALAKLHGTKVAGDRPAIFLAQWINETGWGESPLFKNYNNLFGIKDAMDRSYQAGEVADAGIYSRYDDIAQCARDRVRILKLYAEWSKGKAGLEGDVLAQLDKWWAPEQSYREKLEVLIRSHNLGQYDGPATRSQATPVDGYSHTGPQDARPQDAPPEDLWKLNPAGTNPPAHERTGTSVAGKFLAFLVPVVAGILMAGGKSLLWSLARSVLEKILKVEAVSQPGTPGEVKREVVIKESQPLQVLDLLGGLARPLVDALVRGLNEYLKTHKWFGSSPEAEKPGLVSQILKSILP